MEFGTHEKYKLGKRFTFILILLNLLFLIQFMTLNSISYVPDYGYTFSRKVIIKATNDSLQVIEDKVDIVSKPLSKSLSLPVKVERYFAFI